MLSWSLLHAFWYEVNLTQRYARIYDETLPEQFRETMSHLDAIAVEDWPGSEIVPAELAEV